MEIQKCFVIDFSFINEPTHKSKENSFNTHSTNCDYILYNRDIKLYCNIK